MWKMTLDYYGNGGGKKKHSLIIIIIIIIIIINSIISSKNFPQMEDTQTYFSIPFSFPQILLG
jgi:hypothetical protein